MSDVDRHKTMIRERVSEVFARELTEDDFRMDESDHRIEGVIGAAEVDDDMFDPEEQPGILTAAVVGASEFGNERVAFAFKTEWTDEQEVRPSEVRLVSTRMGA